MNFKLKILAVNTLVFAITLVVLETLSFAVLRVMNGEKPIFYNAEKVISFPSDPVLSWVHRPSDYTEAGFDEAFHSLVFQSIQENIDPIVIVVSGGSTTDNLYDQNNWPRLLFDKLASEGLSLVMYNAAVAGYSSTEEFKKLDFLFTKIHPDIVLSYSGVNEDAIYWRGNRATFFHPSNGIRVLPNLFSMVLGLPKMYELLFKKKDANLLAKNWLINMDRIHKLSEANASCFMGILQPALGMGNQTIPTDNKQWSPSYYRSFYDTLSNVIPTIDYLVNFSSVLDSLQPNVFQDDCHVNLRGNQAVSNEVYQLLKSECSPKFANHYY